ncbi:nitronate monooxygenase [Labrenzia sp. R4_2]|uniref:NAD(P)H-dependent flavin oxidoreductase n=1 Tax=Labrenzia sp. R4_2 TaxID=2821107 RepID=UPI001ADB029B|nr:nitronate monooxygenase family protein [Labrenzia sp. R4_2]MBO9422159.1 nitronate monooxygenase [Labrenzia sp. R4_2]
MLKKRELPKALQNLRLPVVAAPLFIVSCPKLVIAQCKTGVIGSFPALNARDEDGGPVMLEAWLKEITEELDRHNQANPDNPAAPFAVNQIVRKTNERLERDMEICVRWKVPIWITSMGARVDVNEAAHSCGGIALHDVINNTYAKKAIDKGADGLIAVCAGAGGHGGPQSPFALIREIREWFDGPILAGGAVSTGEALLAARVLGADFGYVGSPFVATHEADAADVYKDMMVAGSAEDVITTAVFTGHPATYLRSSITKEGLDPDNLPTDWKPSILPDGDDLPKAWRDIWGAGQGINAVKSVGPAAEVVNRLEQEYKAAISRMRAEIC